MKSNVVPFPVPPTVEHLAYPRTEPCEIIILPVVRIERNPDCPADFNEPFSGPGRRRRRPSSR